MAIGIVLNLPGAGMKTGSSYKRRTTGLNWQNAVRMRMSWPVPVRRGGRLVKKISLRKA
ncbi:hypothetical protein [Pannonibacter phragmitetus]|uniref:hypothetical protein n=1 Tax=Pannonibacter phragmitetus TaxID=121719 RepID=UPI0013CE7602|nr:hypothetical protein [Pannonibacter phragmitetus]